MTGYDQTNIPVDAMSSEDLFQVSIGLSQAANEAHRAGRAADAHFLRSQGDQFMFARADLLGIDTDPED